jgi:ParB family transcriptional regulator, chromosome partitioning protein
VSWGSRRLQLLSGLTDIALAAVCDGRLSSWAASRVVAPLARANSDHADQSVKASGLEGCRVLFHTACPVDID